MTGHFQEEDYLRIHKTLAQRHKKLAHQDNHQIAFLSYNNDDLRKLQNQSGAKTLHDFIMVMEVPNGRLIDGGVERVRDSVIAGFAILGKIPDNKKEDVAFIHKVTNQCKQIGMQCLMRIKMSALHRLTDLPCEELLQGFDMNNVAYEMVTHLNVGYRGYLFTYPLNCNQTMKYDPQEWL